MCFELNTDDFYCNLKNDDKGAGEVKIVISDDAPKGYDWKDAKKAAKQGSGCKAQYDPKKPNGGVGDPRVQIDPPETGDCKKTKFNTKKVPTPVSAESRDTYSDPRKDLGYDLK